jgi:hypothetical protein
MSDAYRQEMQYLEAERADGIAALRAEENRWKFSVESDLAVVGHNPENADMSNPSGEIIQHRYFMVATDGLGYQKRYGYEKSPEAAELVFQLFAPPVSEWLDWRCVYGSFAYEIEGCEVAQLADEMEADLGPNWMVQAPEIAAIVSAGGR